MVVKNVRAGHVPVFTFRKLANMNYSILLGVIKSKSDHELMSLTFNSISLINLFCGLSIRGFRAGI